MSGYRLARLVALLALFLGIASQSLAQTPSPREELLRHVPKDFGLCLVINDLRGYAAKWEASPWIKSLRESALGLDFLGVPELKDLLKFTNDLKKHLDIDWPVLRDDVLGDSVVFAYQPGPPGKPEDEQGILLVHARRPEVLVRLLNNLNQAQKSSGELKQLETRDHKGSKYECRLGPKESQYYLLAGNFFAYSGKEELIQRILEQKQQGNFEAVPLVEHLKKAGADNAVANLWVNPRSFDADFKQKAAGMQGPEGQLVKAFLKNWSAFDAVVLSFAPADNLEFKLSILARDKDLPSSARGLFMEPARPSDLWSRFPENAIFSMAGRMTGEEMIESFVDFAPATIRKTVQKTLEPVAALGGLDFVTSIAPNVGPDWGLCVLPATDPKEAPQALAALAVRSGPKHVGVDHGIYRGVHFLAGVSLFNYNRRHAKDPIRLRTLKQDKVEVKYLANDKFFPPGVQPACALKDGYFLLATSPEAVARFRAGAGQAAVRAEAPFVRISSKELAKALREHREGAIEQLAANNNISKMAAAQGLDNALSVLDLVERIELVRGGGSGQATFVLRVTPAK